MSSAALLRHAGPRLFQPRQSPVIAKIYTRQDAEIVKKTAQLHENVLGMAQSLFAQNFTSTSKISAAKLSAIAHTIDQTLARDLDGFIDHDMNLTGLRRASKQSFSCNNLLIRSAGPDDSAIYSLIAISISATRKGAMIHVSPSRFRWTSHAIKRLYLRSNDHVANSQIEIAQRISNTYSLISCLMASLAPGDSMALPVANGLLLGDVQPLEKDSIDSRDVIIGDHRDFYDHLTFAMNSPSIALLPTSMDNRRVWTAKTYVGPLELKTNQKNYVEIFQSLQNSLPRTTIRSLLTPGIRTVDNKYPQKIKMDEMTRRIIEARMPELLHAARLIRRNRPSQTD